MLSLRKKFETNGLDASNISMNFNTIYFDTNNWSEKIIKMFNKNPEYGILGVAGTTHLPKSGRDAASINYYSTKRGSKRHLVELFFNL